MNVYEKAESLLRRMLAGRRNLDNCVALGLWLLRQHGSHGQGRVFPVPRVELAQDERFARQCGLTASQIRTATTALLECGLLTRISPEREERRMKDPPTQYGIGPEFARLFPVADRHKKIIRFPKETPLFVATWKCPIPRPVRSLPARSDKALATARLEARGLEECRSGQDRIALARLNDLRSEPLPKLSPLALATLAGGRLGQSPASHRLPETVTHRWRGGGENGHSPGRSVPPSRRP